MNWPERIARLRFLAVIMLCSCGQAPAAPSASNSDAGADSEGGQSPEASATVVASITVNQAASAGKIPPGFVGLSYEKAHLTDGFFRATNAPLVALLKLLGPSILRVGANTVDETTWTPMGPGGTDGQIAKPDVDAFAALVKAAGWTSIYAVNLKTSTATVAADEASYAAGALGASLYGFEIGNEPDLYTSTAVEPTWSYDSFKTEWESFATAIRTAVPSAPMTGPAAASDYSDYTVPFASDEASTIGLLTEHYYRDNGASPTATVGELLSVDSLLADMLSTVAAAAKKNAIANGYRLDEANSLYNGGKQGVSDTFASALWAIDFLFTNARYGSSGVNFHGGNIPGWYTPIADADGAVVEVRPIFYGMLLFALAGSGNVLTTSVDASVALSAYAVAAADGSTRIVLANADSAATAHATVDLGKNGSVASVTRLTGASLTATTGIALAGATITASGAWTPGPLPSLQVTGSTLVIDVPPASAALINAQ